MYVPLTEDYIETIFVPDTLLGVELSIKKRERETRPFGDRVRPEAHRQFTDLSSVHFPDTVLWGENCREHCG